MSWLDDLHASDPGAWEAMHDAGRIPPAVDIDMLLSEYASGRCGHGQCVDAHGYSDGCIVVEDE